MKKKKSKEIRTKFDFNDGRKIISMNDKSNFGDEESNNHGVNKAILIWDAEMEKDGKITVIIIIIERISIGTVIIITIIIITVIIVMITIIITVIIVMITIIITVIIVMITIIIISAISTFIREILIINIVKIILMNSNNDND